MWGKSFTKYLILFILTRNREKILLKLYKLGWRKSKLISNSLNYHEIPQNLIKINQLLNILKMNRI
jgi:hypothetical protein